MKPLFIIAIVFSIAISLVGVVAMTNTIDDPAADKAEYPPTPKTLIVDSNSVSSFRIATPEESKQMQLMREGLDGRSYAEVAEINASYREYMGYSKPAAPRAEYDADNVVEQSIKNYAAAKLELAPRDIVSRSIMTEIDDLAFNNPSTSVEKYAELSPEESKQRMKEMFGGSGLPISEFSDRLKDPYPAENDYFDQRMLAKAYP